MEAIEFDEEMEMPCRCRCGQWHELTDGYSCLKRGSNEIICRKCHDEQVTRLDIEDDLNDLICSKENGMTGLTKQINALKKKLIKLGGPLNS